MCKLNTERWVSMWPNIKEHLMTCCHVSQSSNMIIYASHTRLCSLCKIYWWNNALYLNLLQYYFVNQWLLLIATQKPLPQILRMCSTYPMIPSVTSAGGCIQDTCSEVPESAVALRLAGASGNSLARETASRALAWLVPALFSAMHW